MMERCLWGLLIDCEGHYKCCLQIKRTKGGLWWVEHVISEEAVRKKMCAMRKVGADDDGNMVMEDCLSVEGHYKC